MIEKIFTMIGQKETVGEAMKKLEALNPLDMYKDKKAAGALGGASRWKFIDLVDGQWVRIK